MTAATRHARNLRRDATDAEQAIWRLLRSRQLVGHKFRRQHPLGRFVVDFVCLESQLVIELDGGQHATDSTKDESRTRWLEGEGYRVLRFWNDDVLKNRDGVLQTIAAALDGV